MAINAGVPIVPLCCSNYKRDMRLNRWQSGKLRIRSLPPIPTAGLTLDDMPALMERCREQMVTCIADLDAQTA
jgi:1-acyl-sn-glycerol-3-phosphate acyltransferase